MYHRSPTRQGRERVREKVRDLAHAVSGRAHDAVAPPPAAFLLKPVRNSSWTAWNWRLRGLGLRSG